MEHQKLKKNILWIDGLGAIAAGLIVLILSAWLSKWYNLPHEFIIFMGAVNLAYGSYSTPLAMLKKRSKRLIIILASANAVWGCLCFIFLTHFMETISIFGIMHLMGEGLYVGGLAYLEWQWKDDLIRWSTV